jgi:hypothetical protein
VETTTRSLTNQRLARHVRQEINQAVNLFYADHPGYQVAYKALNVRGMRFYARRMNAYLYASNLGHFPKQLAWKARRHGQRARAIRATRSSQCCSLCYHTSRDNRRVQQTFCCQACGFSSHADENAAVNLRARFYDQESQQCRKKEEAKALLGQRHQILLNVMLTRFCGRRRLFFRPHFLGEKFPTLERIVSDVNAWYNALLRALAA